MFKESIKKILVTGGYGFIGGALICRLLNQTKIKIYNLDKMSYASDDTRINLELKRNKNFQERYEKIKVDLQNFEDVKEVINKIKPDLVIHLAAESHVDRSINAPKEFIYSNIIGTFNILESIRIFLEEADRITKLNFLFYHISTDEVFGSLPENGKFNEESPYNPNSPYSSSKASSDHIVKAWGETYNIQTCISNCSNNYGPWQFPEKLIPIVITKALDREIIPIYGDGLNIRDWLYVEDHIDAILLIASKVSNEKSFCIGGNCEKTNLELVEEICNILDKLKTKDSSYKDQIRFVEDRPGHDRRYSIDSKKIKKELSWVPKTPFKEGIEKTVKWYLNNDKWIYKIKKKSGYKGERLGGKFS